MTSASRTVAAGERELVPLCRRIALFDVAGRESWREQSRRDLYTLLVGAFEIDQPQLLVGWIPARRAARVSPLEAMRYE